MYTYRPKELIVLVNGIAMSDFANDSFIEVTPVEEMKYTSHVGSDGITSRTENGNNNYVCKLKFKQGSNSAKTLIGLSNQAGNNDIFNLILMDPAASDEFCNSPKSYIQNRPKGSRGKELHEDLELQIMLVNPINNFY